MKRLLIISAILFLGARTVSLGVETGPFRLLSVAETGKLILVSQLSNKAKFLLDASSAKITLNGKPMEFEDLKSYSVVYVKISGRKTNKGGIEIDGTASEIRIHVPEIKVRHSF